MPEWITSWWTTAILWLRAFPGTNSTDPSGPKLAGRASACSPSTRSSGTSSPSIPRRTPSPTSESLRDSGHRLAVAADDIEKFGGWPGTREWVYERGWLDDFIAAMKGMEEEGGVRLATFSQALAELPSGGLAYLPSSSYREMEEWSLPTAGLPPPGGVEGGVWARSAFPPGGRPPGSGLPLAEFPGEVLRVQPDAQEGLALSKLCRERGDPKEARQALGAAQCNDVYWHGVFGGLYLRHLRDTVWQKLAEAEGRLREGEGLVVWSRWTWTWTATKKSGSTRPTSPPW